LGILSAGVVNRNHLAVLLGHPIIVAEFFLFGE